MLREREQSSTARYNSSPMTSVHNKHFRMLLQQEYVKQVSFLFTSSCTRQSRTAKQTAYYVDFNEPTSVGKCTDSWDINMLQELVYNSTPCYRALCIPNLDGQRHHNNSSSKMDTSISAYDMIHPVIDYALKVSTAINNLRGPIQQHLLLQVRPHHTWPEVRQMVGNFFANSYTHFPGQTIGNIDQEQEGQRKDKKKEKERKGKGYNHNNNNYYYNHYNSYYNQQQHQPQQKGKGKGSIGSYDHNNNNTGKGKNIQKGDKNNKRKGKSRSTTSSTRCWVCGKLGHQATLCWFNNQKNVNNIQQQQLPPQHQHFQLQSTSDLFYVPPEGIATFNFRKIPQQQPQVQYQPVLQALPSTTSTSSVTRVSTPGPHVYDISSVNNTYRLRGRSTARHRETSLLL